MTVLCVSNDKNGRIVQFGVQPNADGSLRLFKTVTWKTGGGLIKDGWEVSARERTALAEWLTHNPPTITPERL